MFRQVNTLWRANVPQLYVETDREKSKTLGVPIDEVFNALGATLGSYYVNDFNKYGRTWQVLMSAEPAYRRRPDDVGAVYLRSGQGQMVPLASLATVNYSSGPETLDRFNNLPSTPVFVRGYDNTTDRQIANVAELGRLFSEGPRPPGAGSTRGDPLDTQLASELEPAWDPGGGSPNAMVIVAQAILRGDHGRLLGFDPAEHPVALQLGGSVPGMLADAAAIGASYGYDEINLNVGCPSDRVQSATFGACLMLQPRLVGDCVRVMRAAVAVPVTVKCRIGIDDHDDWEFLREFVAAIADAGCRKVIVHARKAELKGLRPKQNR